MTTRMFFVTKQINKNENIERERTREKRKLSKLTSVEENTNNKKKLKQPTKLQKQMIKAQISTKRKSNKRILVMPKKICLNKNS